ncbi:hypothetical protein GCM10010520_55980 [Rhizobium viscosum]
MDRMHHLEFGAAEPVQNDEFAADWILSPCRTGDGQEGSASCAGKKGAATDFGHKFTAAGHVMSSQTLTVAVMHSI